MGTWSARGRAQELTASGGQKWRALLANTTTFVINVPFGLCRSVRCVPAWSARGRQRPSSPRVSHSDYNASHTRKRHAKESLGVPILVRALPGFYPR